MMSGKNTAEGRPMLSVRDIHKSFGNNEVLRGINLDVYPGEALALVGGNGAGKSTLVKSIMGVYKPESGHIYIDGEELEFSKPAVSLGKGVYLVPQEPALFPNMTVEQNVLTGFRGKYAALRQKLTGLMGQLGWKLDLARSARTLSIAEQQLVEILRGLLREARVLILDEPTSALTFDEVNALFKIIGDLKQKKISIVYITHRLNEVFIIATSIAIMKDGVITLHGRADQFTRETLVRGLLPEGYVEHKSEAKVPAGGGAAGAKPVFELRHYSGYGFDDVSFTIHEGEALGLAGVVGAGRTELAMTVFGRDIAKSGTALLDGEDITGLKTREIIKRGVNYVCEDRFLNGIFRTATLAANITSSCLRDLSLFFLNFASEREIAARYVSDFRIKTSGLGQEIANLSGGNQQKAVIGRALATNPRLVILDEPTRGIDALARGDIYAIINGLKAQNVAILLISSDIEEIAELSDRTITMFQGRVMAEFRGNENNQDNIMRASFGITGAGVNSGGVSA
ncbi:MAG: sugar ABC transporter ATP-binding protein [Spirochaetaceae bacterium]|jgi:AI-2 transport system ATP-binding protein|nr:sugar ABC transporter ATP-binding protein [Spirochaetaceae bacterium]